MDVLSTGEPEPRQEMAQAQTWPEGPDNLNHYDDNVAAFETFALPGEGELDVEDAFGEHDIEYWVWDGNRLVPAPPDKVARIRELEALERLAWRNQLERWKPVAREPSASATVSRLIAALRRITAVVGRKGRPWSYINANHSPDFEGYQPVPHSVPAPNSAHQVDADEPRP